MKHILLPNNQKFLVLTGIPSHNYSVKEISFLSRFNQFTGNEQHVRYQPSFNEIEGLMEYRQSPEKDAGIKEVKNLEAIINVVRKNKKYYSTQHIGVWIAASSIILIVVLTAIIRHIKVGEANQLYDTYFSIPSSYLIKNKASIDFYTHLNKAVAYYETGNFERALEDFALIPSGTDYTDFALFYKGICFMALNQFSKAMETFESVSSTSAVFIQTKYYSGLCNLKLNRMSAARIIFSELINSKEWAKNAKEILLKLESID
ncbi:MAG TPA: tetratricopeptide repeat protein [Bacteroidales bacterium]|nr:tetratricopeptide repeat protein [Bacteroidales bacterium]